MTTDSKTLGASKPQDAEAVRKESGLSGPMEINLRKILRGRMSGTMRALVPGALISGLEKIIHQEDLNAMLRAGYPNRGSGFATKVLEHLGITVTLKGLDKLPGGRFMFASNHPLGGLDGIALISVLGQKYGDENVRFLVNDLLMNVEPLAGVFLPVNKYGSQGRSAAVAINEALAGDGQVLQFPAGLVSRLQPDGTIADLEWHKAFVTKAIEYDRDIVPVRFVAKNRDRFYRMAYWRKKLGVKINLEQAMLPAELCASRGAHFEIRFGAPLSIEKLKSERRPPKTIAAQIRERVYTL